MRDRQRERRGGARGETIDLPNETTCLLHGALTSLYKAGKPFGGRRILFKGLSRRMGGTVGNVLSREPGFGRSVDLGRGLDRIPRWDRRGGLVLGFSDSESQRAAAGGRTGRADSELTAPKGNGDTEARYWHRARVCPASGCEAVLGAETGQICAGP